MKQEQIKRLLEEAAQSEDWQRRNQIHCELADAVYSDDKDDDRGEGIKVLLDSLYLSTIQNRPDRLPKLLPVFVLMCGDRDGTIIGEIDWKQID